MIYCVYADIGGAAGCGSRRSHSPNRRGSGGSSRNEGDCTDRPSSPLLKATVRLATALIPGNQSSSSKSSSPAAAAYASWKAFATTTTTAAAAAAGGGGIGSNATATTAAAATALLLKGGSSGGGMVSSMVGGINSSSSSGSIGGNKRPGKYAACLSVTLSSRVRPVPQVTVSDPVHGIRPELPAGYGSGFEIGKKREEGKGYLLGRS